MTTVQQVFQHNLKITWMVWIVCYVSLRQSLAHIILWGPDLWTDIVKLLCKSHFGYNVIICSLILLQNIYLCSLTLRQLLTNEDIGAIKCSTITVQLKWKSTNDSGNINIVKNKMSSSDITWGKKIHIYRIWSRIPFKALINISRFKYLFFIYKTHQDKWIENKHFTNWKSHGQLIFKMIDIHTKWKCNTNWRDVQDQCTSLEWWSYLHCAACYTSSAMVLRSSNFKIRAASTRKLCKSASCIHFHNTCR